MATGAVRRQEQGRPSDQAKRQAPTVSAEGQPCDSDRGRTTHSRMTATSRTASREGSSRRRNGARRASAGWNDEQAPGHRLRVVFGVVALSPGGTALGDELRQLEVGPAGAPSQAASTLVNADCGKPCAVVPVALTGSMPPLGGTTKSAAAENAERSRLTLANSLKWAHPTGGTSRRTTTPSP